MKKLIALLMAAVLVLSFAACGGKTADNKTTADQSTTVDKDLKIGIILVGDENEGYTEAHIKGIKEAAANVGIPDDQIIWKYRIAEDETCYDTAMDLADMGCKYIFSNSYSHQSYMVQAAEENPDIIFCPATGDTAAVCGLDNVKNYFTNVYESRYVSGVVAGMKVAELLKDNKIPASGIDKDGNVKIGYVGAYPYAEVVSGYTAFFLGIRSIVENVAMEVTYTNSWFNITAEAEAANRLMADGCVIIGQHADSTGAPSAVEAALKKGQVAYSVGYNVDMLSVAPTAALTSATNVWSVYYSYAFKCAISGEDIATDWCKGYSDDAVAITDLGASCAPGTKEKVDETIDKIKSGELHVFSTDTFTVEGNTLTEHDFDFSTMNADFTEVLYKGETINVISDGYFHESEYRSAPYFDLRIDGITELSAENK
ncbi:MAG: BMP family ABC transporter substrate-binding protein [Clostridiales bacterium]|nr:BMP family ABC transporter substrate-binding protein [Clostridiales bacterium]